MGSRYEVLYDNDGFGADIILDTGERLRAEVLNELKIGVLEQLAQLEKSVFGRGAFGEYKICSARAERGNCGRVISMDSAIDKETKECPSCASNMEDVFPYLEHIKYLQWIFDHGVKAVLLMDSERSIVGFSLMFVASLTKCFDEINYRRGYDLNLVKGSVERCLSLDADSTQFVCANRVGFAQQYQGYGLLPFMLRFNAQQFPDAFDLPAIGDTMIHPLGKLFAPVFAAGYSPLTLDDGSMIIDEHGGVLLAINRFGDFINNLNLSSDEFIHSCGSRLQEARGLQHHLVDAFPSPDERHYRNASILRAFAHDPDLQFFNCEDCNGRVVENLSRCFREVFSNAFGQYLFYLSNGLPIAPSVIFGDRYVSIEELDALDLDSPGIPVDGEKPQFWHHPKLTQDIIAEKLRLGGNVSAIFDGLSMRGFCFGYKSTFVSAFREFEEWENTHLYSGFDLGTNRDFESALNVIREAGYSINAETEVYILNAIGLAPNFRSNGNLGRLFRKFFSNLSPDMDDLIVVLETKFLSKAYNIFQRAGAKVVNGVLNYSEQIESGDIVMMIGNLGEFRRVFSLSDIDFRDLTKS